MSEFKLKDITAFVNESKGSLKGFKRQSMDEFIKGYFDGGKVDDSYYEISTSGGAYNSRNTQLRASKSIAKELGAEGKKEYDSILKSFKARKDSELNDLEAVYLNMQMLRAKSYFNWFATKDDPKVKISNTKEDPEDAAYLRGYGTGRYQGD